VSRRQSVVGDRARRPAAVEPPSPTRAEALVASGLLDVATGITDFAHSLTNSAVEAIETRMSEQGRSTGAADVHFLRKAVFTGIAENIINRIEQNLKTDPTRVKELWLKHINKPCVM
jgi:hypothetical protein